MHLPKPNDTQFELPPAGTFLAVCYRVIDLGTQETTYMGQAKHQHKILLSWELPDEKMADGRPFTISQRYTWSMSEKATLRKNLESWRGTPFKEADFGEGGFDIKNIIGKACLLTIVHTEKGDKHYANINGIARLMKGMEAPKVTANEQIYLWINKDRWVADVFHKLSDNIKAAIMASPEYKELVSGYSMDDRVPVLEDDGRAQYDQDIPF